MASNYELSVVVPAYNEAGNIAGLIKDWHQVFTANNIRYQFIVIDDGSIDNTVDILRSLQKEIPHLNIFTQSNMGHGPAILKGYKLAMESPWVFQMDADHQFETGAFTELWKNRNNYDMLLAERKEKHATLLRNIVSAYSGFIVYVLYGPGIKDVNSPYRLIRTAKLKEALNSIPGKSFAPNVLITAFFIFTKKRIFTNVVTLRAAAVAKKSRMNTYIFKGCIKSVAEVIKFRFSL